MRQTQESFTIYHQYKIKATALAVYDCITQPQHLINWWPLTCTGLPILDEIYNFNFGPQFNWFAKVIHCQTGKGFHVALTQADEGWNPTSFGFDLKEMENTTIVDFWHSGWQQCNDDFKITSYCWAILLQGLKQYIENDVILPFNQRG